MPQTISCSDFSFPLLPHAAALDLIAAIGIAGVDVGLFNEGSHLKTQETLDDAQRVSHELRTKLDDRGLLCCDIYLIPGGLRGLAVNHPDPAQRRDSCEIFQRTVDFVLRCNCRHLSGLPGMPWPDDEPLEDSFQRATDELNWRVQQATKAGVTFAVEPHLGSIIPTPRLAQRLIEQTPGLTLTLDYGHFTCEGISDDEIEPLISSSSHCHVRGAANGRLQMPLSRSAIDHARMIRAMQARGYAGCIALEYVWDPHDHCDEVDVLSETILTFALIRKILAER